MLRYLPDRVNAAENGRNPHLIAAMLIVIDVFIRIAKRRRIGDKPLDKVGWGDDIAIGLAPALSIVPGTSRSGATITAGLCPDLNRETAASFSFLLARLAIAP
jgi:undecaprenyl-diphosphatase